LLYQIKLIWGTECLVQTVNLNNEVTAITTAPSDILNVATSLNNQLNRIQPVAVMDGAQGFVMVQN
jgi:hypothetical protein